MSILPAPLCRYREIGEDIGKESDALFRQDCMAANTSNTQPSTPITLEEEEEEEEYIYIFLYACATQSKRSKIPIKKKRKRLRFSLVSLDRRNWNQKKTYVKRMERRHPHTRQRISMETDTQYILFRKGWKIV